MFMVAFGYALVTQFAVLTGVEIAYLGGLTLLSILIDYLSGMFGAKLGGASGKSLLVGVAGLLLGTLLLPPLGGILGMFLGVAGGEIYYYGKTSTAVKAASGGVIGALAGMVLNLLVGLTFVILFIVFVL